MSGTFSTLTPWGQAVALRSGGDPLVRRTVADPGGVTAVQVQGRAVLRETLRSGRVAFRAHRVADVVHDGTAGRQGGIVLVHVTRPSPSWWNRRAGTGCRPCLWADSCGRRSAPACPWWRRSSGRGTAAGHAVYLIPLSVKDRLSALPLNWFTSGKCLLPGDTAGVDLNICAHERGGGQLERTASCTGPLRSHRCRSWHSW